MLSTMQDTPLLIRGIIRHGEDVYSEKKIFTVTAEGVDEATFYRVSKRAEQLAAALAAVVTAALFEMLIRRHFGPDAWLAAAWFGAATATDLYTGRLPFAFGLVPAALSDWLSRSAVGLRVLEPPPAGVADAWFELPLSPPPLTAVTT